MNVTSKARVFVLAHFSDGADTNFAIFCDLYPALNFNDRNENVQNSVERSRNCLLGVVAIAEFRNAWIHTSSLPNSFTT
jgi:hypothetical protein